MIGMNLNVASTNLQTGSKFSLFSVRTFTLRGEHTSHYDVLFLLCYNDIRTKS